MRRPVSAGCDTLPTFTAPFLLLCNIPAKIIFFILFRRVNGIVEAIAVCCGLVGTPVEGLALLFAYVPLKLAVEGSALDAFSPAQLQALSYISVQLQHAGLLVSSVLYGPDELASGFLLRFQRLKKRGNGTSCPPFWWPPLTGNPRLIMFDTVNGEWYDGRQ